MPLKKLGILALAILGTCTAHTFEMNNLRFSNRAQCAVDSEKPTDTVFLIVDGYNAGKLGNSLGRLNGQEPTEVANESMRQFRIATAKLTQLVIDKLTYGHLPLLPVDTSAKTSLVRYQKLAANCDGKVYCEDLEQYVAELWAQSSLPASARRWNQIDSINSSHFTSSAWIRGSSCAYIKRFSALQGHLHGTEPTKPSLEELARNYMNRAEFMTGCADTAAELDNRNAIWDEYGKSKAVTSFADAQVTIQDRLAQAIGDVGSESAKASTLSKPSYSGKAADAPARSAGRRAPRGVKTVG